MAEGAETPSNIEATNTPPKIPTSPDDVKAIGDAITTETDLAHIAEAGDPDPIQEQADKELAQKLATAEEGQVLSDKGAQAAVAGLNELAKNGGNLESLEDLITNGEKNVKDRKDLIEGVKDIPGIGKLLATVLSWLSGGMKEALKSNKNQLALNKFKKLSEEGKFDNTPLAGQIGKEIVDMDPKQLDHFFDAMRAEDINLSKDGIWEKLMTSDNNTYVSAREKITSVMSELDSDPTKKEIATQLNSIKEMYTEEKTQKTEQVAEVTPRETEKETETTS